MSISINWFNLLLYGLTTFVAAFLAMVLVLRLDKRLSQRRPPPAAAPRHASPPPQPPVSFEDHATQAAQLTKRRPSGRALLATPPTIDGVTLRDYLVHHATRKCPHPDANGRPQHAGTWPCVVEDVYATALDSPLAHYFDGVDLSHLKRHFLSALVTLTNVGLTVETAGRLQAQHADLDITAADFDLVVHVLIESIGSYTTPAVMKHVLPQLTPAVVELKKRIVTA